MCVGGMRGYSSPSVWLFVSHFSPGSLVCMLLCVVYVLCACVYVRMSECMLFTYVHMYIRTHVYVLSMSLTCHSLTNRKTRQPDQLGNLKVVEIKHPTSGYVPVGCVRM